MLAHHLVAFLAAVGFDSVLSKDQIHERMTPRREANGAFYCGCGRRISANKDSCLACEEAAAWQAG